MGTESTQEEEVASTTIKRVKKEESEEDSPRWALKQEIHKRGRGKRQGSRREGKSGGSARAWCEEPSHFLQEKISAIHVDPEALIQGGEGAQWMKAFSKVFLPLDPETPQPGRPGTGLGSWVP